MSVVLTKSFPIRFHEVVNLFVPVSRSSPNLLLQYHDNNHNGVGTILYFRVQYYCMMVLVWVVVVLQGVDVVMFLSKKGCVWGNIVPGRPTRAISIAGAVFLA